MGRSESYSIPETSYNKDSFFCIFETTRNFCPHYSLFPFLTFLYYPKSLCDTLEWFLSSFHSSVIVDAARSAPRSTESLAGTVSIAGRTPSVTGSCQLSYRMEKSCKELYQPSSIVLSLIRWVQSTKMTSCTGSFCTIKSCACNMLNSNFQYC